MCGIAGLFAGCAALSVCPKALLSEPTAPTDADPLGAAPEYSSPFARWYERAAVRTAERRELSPGDEDRLLFPPDLVPIARHRLIVDGPPRIHRQVLARHAYRYLDFTARLELVVVNRTVAGIAQGSVAVDVPDQMRLDAYKIYCDEAYHALTSADLIRQLSARTGIPPLPAEEPFFLTRLARIQESVAPEIRPLVELLFVICSETLITSTLAEVPDDPSIVAAVRHSVRDHAKDEGRHHAYFVAFLRYLWAQLDRPLRRTAGRLLPALITAFTHPDVPSIRQELLGYGLRRDGVEEALAEVYSGDVVQRYARDTARRTLRYFAELDAFDDAATRDALVAHQLVEEADMTAEVMA